MTRSQHKQREFILGPIAMTQHASIRQQQRGVPLFALTQLLEFGRVSHGHRGGEVLYFDKRAKQARLNWLGKDLYRRVVRHFNLFAVRATDGVLLTVGHHHKKIWRA